MADGWATPIEDSFADIEAELLEQIREPAYIGAEFLTYAWPVRTGQLRGGTQAGLNEDPPFSRPPDDKNGAVTIAFMHGVISQMQLGDVLIMINYTPHGIYINDGTSKIPPQRQIERTIEAMSAVLD